MAEPIAVVCGECGATIGTVPVLELRPGFFTNMPAQPLPGTCPNGHAAERLRAETAPVFEKIRTSVRFDKQQSILRRGQ